MVLPSVSVLWTAAKHLIREAQLMLTNPSDASVKVTKHSIPFHMLGILSYCAIVTLSLDVPFF